MICPEITRCVCFGARQHTWISVSMTGTSHPSGLLSDCWGGLVFKL
uniref:Uncharacterized protein n=1 Tax=Anguilla anguilla TaxID=7936 RepID=A0A0E9QVM2_ANGAN